MQQRLIIKTRPGDCQQCMIDWQLEGNYQPAADVEEKLKCFCRQIFELFNQNDKILPS
jgi:hypothetical protein